MNYLVIKTRQLMEKLKYKVFKKLWMDKFIAFRRKMYAYKYEDYKKNKKKLVNRIQKT